MTVWWPLAQIELLPGMPNAGRVRNWYARGHLPSTRKGPTGRLLVDVAEVQSRARAYEATTTVTLSKGDEMPPLLLTLEDAGAALGIKRTKVYQLIKAGDLESVRIGTARRVPVASVERFARGLTR
jgi:excisionase family DNA binding protein